MLGTTDLVWKIQQLRLLWCLWWWLMLLLLGRSSVLVQSWCCGRILTTTTTTTKTHIRRHNNNDDDDDFRAYCTKRQPIFAFAAASFSSSSIDEDWKEDEDGSSFSFAVDYDDDEEEEEGDSIWFDSEEDEAEADSEVILSEEFASNVSDVVDDIMISGNSSSNSNNNTMILPWNDVLVGASSNVSYFYLKYELRLSEEAMWRIMYDAPSALGMTASTIRRKVQVLQETMNLTREELRTILQTSPTLLHLSADQNLGPTILYLLRLLDLSRPELKALVVACPPVLSYSKTNLRNKVRFFTNVMKYTVPETRTLLLKEPKLLRSSVRTGLIPHLRFWVRDMNLRLPVLRNICLINPRAILLYSLDQNLVPKLVFFCIMTLHMETEHLERLLLQYPQFLDYHLDRHTLPMARYFLQDLELNAIELRSLFLAYPRIVTHSLVKIKHTVGFLRYEVGLAGPQVKRVLYQAPQVLGLSDDSMRAKIRYLQQTLELNSDDKNKEDVCELRLLLAGMPRLLVLNVERNLQPKLEYLWHDAFSEDRMALRLALLRLPTLLGYSLEQRIKPRVKALLNHDPVPLDPSAITIGISMKQENFESWLARRKQKAAAALAAAAKKVQPQTSSQQQQQQLPERMQNGIFSFLPIPKESKGRIVHWTRERRPRRT